LFQAVVVAGAALGCGRGQAPAGDPPPVTPVVSVQGELPEVAEPQPPPVASAPAPAVAPAPPSPNTPPTPSATSAKRPCPPGSEMPFPPCYFIL
jgi:hypothetical protein